MSLGPIHGIGTVYARGCGFSAALIGARHDGDPSALAHPVSMQEPHICTLEAAAGERELCPGQPCPFWSGDACAIAGLRVDLGASEGLGELLLRLRDELGERAASNYGLLPPGLR